MSCCALIPIMGIIGDNKNRYQFFVLFVVRVFKIKCMPKHYWVNWVYFVLFIFCLNHNKKKTFIIGNSGGLFIEGKSNFYFC